MWYVSPSGARRPSFTESLRKRFYHDTRAVSIGRGKHFQQRKQADVKKKVGAKPIAPELRRVKIGTSVDPVTADQLAELAERGAVSQGKVLDRLVAREHRKVFGVK
jgi:hypothetical protein